MNKICDSLCNSTIHLSKWFKNMILVFYSAWFNNSTFIVYIATENLD
jgi:hypothetical protein